jgi:hypothetical protein
MRRPLLALGLCLGLVYALPAAEPDAKEKPVLRITVNTEAAPDLAAWGDKAKVLVEKWHPKVAELLASDGFTPPTEVKLVFKSDKKGIASTSGNTITFSSEYIRDHPEDWGMVVHELTHVIQGYRKGGPGWLTEGIADYVRFFHYEPETKLGPINPKRASYKDGYRTTAAFLAWVEKQHDAKLVNKLNASMRRGEYKDELFKDCTRKSLDELWNDYLESMK